MSPALQDALAALTKAEASAAALAAKAPEGAPPRPEFSPLLRPFNGDKKREQGATKQVRPLLAAVQFESLCVHEAHVHET
jgi:hypothetical protein